MRSVVTGASGHLGAALVRELLCRGEAVRVLVRRSTRALDGLDVERAAGDVLDVDSLRRAFAGADVVYHLAGVISLDGDPTGRVRAVNVDGAENAARIALETGVRRFIHMSSVHAFLPEPVEEPLDESRQRANAPGVRTPAYDRSKADGEDRVRAVVQDGLDAVVLHPTAVLGPFDFAPSRAGRMLLDLQHRRLPVLTAGGFDWVDVRDVARTTCEAAEHGRRGESYLVGGAWSSLTELAATASEVTGAPAPRFAVGFRLAALGLPFTALFGKLSGREPTFTAEALRAVRDSPRVDDGKARRELGHRTRPLAETLCDTYAFLGANPS